MEIGHFIMQPEEILKRLRRFIYLDDAEFFRAFLEPLSPEEIAEFHQLCPEFPSGHLPQKNT